MSAIGFLSSSVMDALLSRGTQNSFEKFKQNFQQLGQDLQSGNVSKAQADLAALQPAAALNQPSSVSPSLVSQSFNQIARDLQSGNLTAAQSDYTSLEQNLEQASDRTHHHHLHVAGPNASMTQAQQALSQLGQALQAGNLNAAGQAYSALQTDLVGFAAGSSGSTGVSSSAATGVNLSA